MCSSGFIGALIGIFITHSFWGALVGYFLGSFFGGNFSNLIDRDRTGVGGDNDTQHSRRPYNRDEHSNEQANTSRTEFLRSLLLLSAHIIQADGKIMHSEMNYVRQMLRQSFGQQAEQQGDEILKRLFERRREVGEAQWRQMLDQACHELARAMTEEQRLQLLTFLCQIAKADGRVDPTEVTELYHIALMIDLPESHIDQLLNLGGKTLDEAYRLLGITPDATDAEVRHAYRRMALQHHPDKVATLGEDVRRAAEQKFKEIGEAKEMIFKARGL